MSDTKISSLPSGTPTTASIFPIVKSGTNYKSTIQELIDFCIDSQTWTGADISGSGYVYSHLHYLNTTDVTISLYLKSGITWILQDATAVAIVTGANEVEFHIGTIGATTTYKSIISRI